MSTEHTILSVASRLLIALCVVTATFAGFAPASEMPLSETNATATSDSTELVDRWSADDGSGSVVTGDAWGTDGSYNGSWTTTGTVSNSALDLDGTDDYVDLGDLGTARNGTFSAHFSTTDTDGGIVDAANFGSDGAASLWVENSNLTGSINIAGTDYKLKSSSKVDDGTLRHTAFKWHYNASTNTTTASLYIDGSSVDSISKAGEVTNAGLNPTYIGAGTGDRIYLAGTIDEVRIYKSTLSDSQISGLHSSPTAYLSGSETLASASSSTDTGDSTSVGDNRPSSDTGEWELGQEEFIDGSRNFSDNPSVIKSGGKYHLFYTSKDASDNYHISHATSENLKDWTVQNRDVLGAVATNPTIAQGPNGDYHLYYTVVPSGTNSHEMHHAVSSNTDFSTWTKDSSNPVLQKSADGWDSQRVTYAEIVTVSDKFYMFYRGQAPDDSMAIGYAVSDDGSDFSKAAKNPVFEPSAAWEDADVGHPDIGYHNGTWYLAYMGGGNDNSSTGVGLATSDDLTSGSWTRDANNPELPTPSSGWGSKAIAEPELVWYEEGDHWRMLVGGKYDGTNETIGLAYGPGPGAGITGQVVTQNGDPVANATVVAVAHNKSAYSGTLQEVLAKIEATKDKISDPLPPLWDDWKDVNVREKLKDEASLDTTSRFYPTAHYRGDWVKESSYIPLLISKDGKTAGISPARDPALKKPRTKFSPDDPIFLSCWDSNAAGTLFQDNVDGDLPGTSAACNMTVSRLGPSGSVTSELTVEPQQIYDPYVGDPASAAIIPAGHLDPGVYEVSAEAPSGGQTVSYPIVVSGNRDPKSLERDVQQAATDVNDKLTNRAQELRDLRAENKIRNVTLTTNENGSFSIRMDRTLYPRVQLYAYRKPDGMSTDAINVTEADVTAHAESTIQQARTEFQTKVESGDIEGAQAALGDLACGESSETDGAEAFAGAYFAASPTSVKNPSDTTVRVYGADAATPDNLPLGDMLCQKAALIDYLRTNGLDNLIPGVLDDLQNMTPAQIRERYETLKPGIENSPETCREALRNMGVEDTSDCGGSGGGGGAPSTGGDGSYGPPGSGLPANPDDATTDQLRDAISNTTRAIDELRDTIDSGEPTTAVGDETVSLRFPFERTVKSDEALVFVDYSNGTTTMLNTSSEYVSIDKGLPGGGSEVVVSDYPLGQGDATAANFRVKILSAEGAGSSSEGVVNPTFAGTVPDLSSIRVSSLTPSEGDTVSVATKAPASSSFGSLQDLRVRYPSGAEQTITSVSDDTAQFTANETGSYRVRAVFNDADAEGTFQETVVVRAGSGPPRGPVIRGQSGPIGRYAVVTGALEDGDYEVSRGGQQVRVAGILASGADVPGEVEVHLESADLAPTSTTTVRMLEGERESAVRSRVLTRVYFGQASDDALVYRGGSTPVTDEFSQAGRAFRENGSLVVEAQTDPQGELELRVLNDPSRIDKAVFRVRTIIADIDLPLVGGFLSPDATLGLGTVPIGLGLLVGRRGWSA